MKKLMAFVLSVVCILALYGCGWNSQIEVATVFSESVTKVDVTHFMGGKTTTWSVEGTDIVPLREWYNTLSYRYREFEKGQSPGDSNGGEVYTFVFTGVEWPGFSYVINGENDCYIQSEGNWFIVTNPSMPPVAQSAE